jgi:glycosyltransferase involved in cell wall biosynthesis
VRGQRRLGLVTRSFLDARKARKIIKELRPDVVHGQDIGHRGDIATQISPNAVVTVHGLVHVEFKQDAASVKGWIRYRLVLRLVKSVLLKAKAVISISDYDARELAGLVHGTHVSIPNPTAAEFFTMAPSIETEPRLLFAGVLTPRKNPEGLLDAFAEVVRKVPAARLVVVGPQPDADYARTIREKATALGLDGNIDFVGMVDNVRLHEELKASRAVVLFSREETSPTILAQAMAAGKPVVSSRVGGIPEMVVDGESGFLVDPGDIAAFAEGAITVLQDQELALKLGARGHELALARFEPSAVARRTAEVYWQVAEQSSGRSATTSQAKSSE